MLLFDFAARNTSVEYAPFLSEASLRSAALTFRSVYGTRGSTADVNAHGK